MNRATGAIDRLRAVIAPAVLTEERLPRRSSLLAF